MRIGLVSYEYPPQQGLGGVGTYMFRLAGALGAAGHDVHVIAGPSDRSPVPQPNVTLHRIPAKFEIRSHSTALRWLYWQGLARVMAWMHPLIWHWIKWDLASYEALRSLDAAVVHFDDSAGGVTDAEGIYGRFLDGLGCEAVLVRPDFYLVGGARAADELNRLVDVMRVHLDATGRAEGCAA